MRRRCPCADRDGSEDVVVRADVDFSVILATNYTFLAKKFKLKFRMLTSLIPVEAV